MKWVRIDTSLYRNPKFYPLPSKHPRAVVAWLGGLTLAGDIESDGLVPIDQLRTIHARRPDADLLVDAGLWVPVSGGYLIHDWADYQPTRKTTREMSERARQAANTRWRKDDA